MTEGHTPDLIERVEAATETDPDLFWEAHYAVNPKPDTIWRDEEREVWTAEYAAYIALGHRFCELIEAGAFLDAARTLLPDYAAEGGGWRIECHSDLKRKYFASVWLHEHAEPCDGWFNGWSKCDLATALISASLKARAIP